MLGPTKTSPIVTTSTAPDGCHKPILAQKRGTHGTNKSTVPTAFEEPNVTQLTEKKVRDIYTKVYNVREIIFSNQTGQYPKRSLRENKYIMVLVEIDSNAIMVAHMKIQHENEMKQAYKSMVTRLHRTGIVPKNHMLDNTVSESMKAMSRDKCHMTMELVPPGCHRHNTAEVAIQNFKAHFHSVLAGVADKFPMQL